MNWYVKVLKDCLVFEGRATRTEYWMFVLISLIISVILGIVDGFIDYEVGYGIGILGFLYVLAMILPSIAVGIRRLHDSDKTGWFMLVLLIPGLGGLILLILMVLESTPGDNRYGPNPHGQSAPS